MAYTDPIILFVGVLLLVSVLAGAISPRIGLPLLLVFLVLGMLAGESGPGGVVFDDVGLAHFVANVALAIILFDGGVRTDRRLFRTGLAPALSLATFGVILTASLTGLVAKYVLGLGWPEAMLLGAIVGSTDAAAVFATLQGRDRGLNERVAATLEIESGTNDPMAIFLTVMLVEILAAGGTYAGFGIIGDFFWQMGGGAVIGLATGTALAWGINRLTLTSGLYPLLALSGGLVTFGAAQLVDASGFLAVYIAGLVLGNRRVQALHNIQRFNDGMAWLAQIALFMMLGLLVSPPRILEIAPQGLLIALALIFVARPLAVLVTLAPFRFRWRERAYIAWVGLRGAVPIVLAMFPLLADLPDAQLFFNITFFIVFVSLVLQGWTVTPFAHWLRVEVPAGSSRVQRVELELPGQLDYEVIGYHLAADSPAIGMPLLDLLHGLDTRATLVVRGGRLSEPRTVETLKRDDHVYLVAPQDEVETLDAIFVARHAPDHLGTRAFFGEFVLNPGAALSEVGALYGFDVPERYTGCTIEEVIQEHFRKPVVGDRLTLGQIELVVREIDADRPVKVGLKLGGHGRA